MLLAGVHVCGGGGLREDLVEGAAVKVFVMG